MMLYLGSARSKLLVAVVAAIAAAAAHLSFAAAEVAPVWGNAVISLNFDATASEAGEDRTLEGNEIEQGIYNVWVVASGEGDALIPYELEFSNATWAVNIAAEHKATWSVDTYVGQLADKHVPFEGGNVTVRITSLEPGLSFRRLILIREPDYFVDWNMSAADVVQHMGMGINLGTTFEKDNSRETNQEHLGPLIEKYWDMGYRNLRIPVMWGRDMWRVPIGSILYDEVVWTVKHALDLGFFVIIDSHNDEWLFEEYDGSPKMDEEFYSMWVQIATAFSDFDEFGHRLVFEVLNEPNNRLGSWIDENFFGAKDPLSNPVDSDVAIRWTRNLNEVGYQAIRSVSPDRVIFVEPNGYGAAVTLPNIYPSREYLPGGGDDDKLGIALHAYNPQEFVFHDDNDDWWDTRGGPNGMRQFLTEANERTQANLDKLGGIPVWFSEYGIGRTTAGARSGYMFRLFMAIQSLQMWERGWAGSIFSDVGWFSVCTYEGDDFGFFDAIFGSVGL